MTQDEIMAHANAAFAKLNETINKPHGGFAVIVMVVPDDRHREAVGPVVCANLKIEQLMDIWAHLIDHHVVEGHA